MKKLLMFFIGLSFISHYSSGQTEAKTIQNKDFNWTITIPLSFESVEPAEWAKMQNKGAAAIEKTYDGKVENHAKTIFVFKSDQFNYFESNYQPFDVSKDGNYMESFKAVNEILYQTFKAQMAKAKIDTSYSQETISGLNFQTFKMKLAINDDVRLYWIMFSRLFDKKEFTVNVMYLNPQKGNLMLNAWRNSKFGN